MKDRKIVRRTYTKINSSPSNLVEYAVAPKDASGGECFSSDIEKAHLFKEDVWLTASFDNCTMSGNNRYGDFAYKQEIITVQLVIENEKTN